MWSKNGIFVATVLLPLPSMVSLIWISVSPVLRWICAERGMVCSYSGGFSALARFFASIFPAIAPKATRAASTMRMIGFL